MFAVDASDFPGLPVEQSETMKEPQGVWARDRSISGTEPSTPDPIPRAARNIMRGLNLPDPVSRELSRTPPIRIPSHSPARHMLPEPAIKVTLPETKPDFALLSTKAAKRRKKKRHMRPADPALNTVRGFYTPVTSGGEESDMSVTSTPRLGARIRDLPSLTASPALRPASAGHGSNVSLLSMRLDSFKLEQQAKSLAAQSSDFSSADSITSETGSDSDKTEMDSYEVNLEHDFVSSDVCPPTGPGAGLDSVPEDELTRKMTAADFEPLTCLGKGTYGTVLLVKQKSTGRLYAQKQLRKATLTVKKKLVEQTKTERAILESVNRHPFVVKLFYAFQDHEKLYLILEYAQGGELFHHLASERMFNDEVASFYMAELVLALEHLHRNVGVVYRDLKPENCLLDSDGHLLLTDFGLSKVAVDEGDTCKSILGTIEYMAPEVIMGQEYGMAVDWWSLGALGYDLLTGNPPFTANNHAKTEEKILKQKLQLPYFLGPDAKDLLTRLLRKEPKKRLGANMPKDMQIIKNHRFFKKIDWKKLARREVPAPLNPLVTDPALAENFAKEFTDLAVSPVTTRPFSGLDEGDPFGGFSFVASSSLLEGGEWGF